MAVPTSFNIQNWIAEHEAELKPPVNNKVLHPDESGMIVQVVGGPNTRTDYHFEPYPEWFYQVKGDMHVNVIEDDGTHRRIDIREGEVWMLPGRTAHSPQRPNPGSIGIVVEIPRPEGETEEFRWYCPECSTLIHSATLQVRDIVKDLPPVFEQFYAMSDAERTCPKCGTVHPGKG